MYSLTYRGIFLFFWKHIRPYRGYFAVMAMAPIVTSFYAFAYNYAIKLFLDRMTVGTPTPVDQMMGPILLFLATQVTLDLVWRLSDYAQMKSEPYIKQSIVSESYDYVQHHDYTFFQNNLAGAISSRLKGLLDGFEKLEDEILHGITFRLLKVVVNLCALAFVSMNLGVFILSWSLVYFTVMYRFSLRLTALTYDVTASKHTLVGRFSDKISNVISIFSFAARKRELATLNDFMEKDFVPKQITVLRYDLKFQIVGGLLYLVKFVFLLFYMIHLKNMGSVSIGDFALVFGLTLVLAEDIWHSTVSFISFSRLMGDIKTSMTLLAEPQKGLDAKDAKDIVIKGGDIRFSNLVFSHGKDNHRVFENMSLHIKSGEKIGLVGRSGAGKTSLIHLLLRYFTLQGGSIEIDGHDIQHVSQDSLRSQIALIPQDTHLFHRTLRDNILFGNPGASEDDLLFASQKAHVHEFAQTLPMGYDTMVGERGLKLSGGQRQRIAIARAILKDAPILILDEATSALDSQTENLIQESLNYLMDQGNKTVIAIAHRLSTLRFMDRIVVLDKGKIIEEGTHEMLMEKPNSLYGKLWELQEI